MAFGRLVRQLDCILARPEQLQTVSDSSGKRRRVRLAARGKKRIERTDVRLLPAARRRRSAASSTMRRPAIRGAKRGASTRPALSRKRAVDAVGRDHQILDELLRAILAHQLDIDDLAVLKDGPRLICFETERAALDSERVAAPARPGPAARSCCASPATAARCWRRGIAIEPCSDAVIGELRVIQDKRAVDASGAAIWPSASTSSR